MADFLADFLRQSDFSWNALVNQAVRPQLADLLADPSGLFVAALPATTALLQTESESNAPRCISVPLIE